MNHTIKSAEVLKSAGKANKPKTQRRNEFMLSSWLYRYENSQESYALKIDYNIYH